MLIKNSKDLSNHKHLHNDVCVSLRHNTLSPSILAQTCHSGRRVPRRRVPWGKTIKFSLLLKIKELKSTARTPLGEKKANVVYQIPCKCKDSVYIGETYRMFETRKKEHEAKVRLTKRDIEDGNIESAEVRIGKEDGGLAKHSTQCSQGIDWKNSKIVTTERIWKQRKVREGIESEKLKLKGKNPLNNYEHPEDWKAVILGYTKLEPPQKD